MPQKAQLFAGSIRDNLLMGSLEASDEELWQALSLAQAKDVVLAKPASWTFSSSRKAETFPAGKSSV